ncbi:MAG: 16S rRNA (cytidine(1402)-2'-O)-methyltransferase [Candidatus Gastranaerophilales bacterium]|nr:16S rRNA (cytidine(1402)-2'-O)-methyltransferase [Candidatus Gastranaerophilales bacterium]
MSKGDLFVVATPVGNLKDITLRALETLNSADLIACEDTRVTQKLLNYYDIKTKTVSYHKFSEKQQSEKLIALLNSGKNIALVSDAGTPLISDPGSILIEIARQNGIKVIPVGGISAVTTLLSAVESYKKFAFIGFFPQKESEVVKISDYLSEFDIVFYESPNRILATIETIKKNFGDVKVSIGRELTKMFEDINTLSACEMIEYLKNTTLKGEITGIIHSCDLQAGISDIDKYIKKLIAKGFSSKDISVILSEIFEVSKNEVYEIVQTLQKK